MILLPELEDELKRMKSHSPSFKLIKAELKRRGHWKDLPRGWQVAGLKQCAFGGCTRPTRDTYCKTHSIKPATESQ